MNDSELIALVEQRSQEWASSPVLPDDIIEALYQSRVFKLFIPEESGGRPSTLTQATHLYEQLAKADGSIGWLVQIGAGGGFFVPSFDYAIAKQLFSLHNSVIAGSGYPTGIARRVPGGYRCTGKWRYASGAQYATLFTANAILEESDTFRAFAFTREQVHLSNDWHTIGMRATSSWSFSVEDAFVPDEMSFVVGEKVWEPGLPVYKLPFVSFAIASIGSVAVGCAMGFFDEALNVVQPARRNQVEEIAQVATLHRQRFFDIIERIEVQYAARATTVDNDHDAGLRECVAALRGCVFDAVSAVGMYAAQEHTRLNRALRDLLVVCLHELVRPSARPHIGG